MSENISQKDKEEAGGSGCVFTSKQRKEYFDKLEKWLFEAYAWHSFVASFPYLVTTSQMLHGECDVVLLLLHYTKYDKKNTNFFFQGATSAAKTNIGATLANANITSNNQQINNQQVNPTRDSTPAAVLQPVPGVTGNNNKVFFFFLN